MELLPEFFLPPLFFLPDFCYRRFEARHGMGNNPPDDLFQEVLTGFNFFVDKKLKIIPKKN